jgi:ACT domain-containing protein
MLDQYLIIHKSILPEYYEKVIEARHLIEDGKIRDVSQAVRQVGISRSTYYKYKDFILEPTEISGGRKAVLSMMLNHEQGILSALLIRISEAHANILTITQSLPIRDKASVTISLDVSEVDGTMEDFVARLSEVPGVEQMRVLAVE